MAIIIDFSEIRTRQFNNEVILSFLVPILLSSRSFAREEFQIHGQEAPWQHELA